jgi:molybdate transport system permease protein
MGISLSIAKQLNDFHLEVQFQSERRVIGFLGTSGSGKSITLRAIAGLMIPDHGRIVIGSKVFFDSKEGINLAPQARKTGFLFQNYALFPNMTVSENIATCLAGLNKKQRALKVAEKLAMMKIEHLGNLYPSELSGGQQQRAALARALAVEPEILLLDEPFSALDHLLRGQLERELIRNLSDFPGTVIFVTHDLNECYRVCDDVLIMEKGKVISSGPKEKIFFSPPNKQSAKILGYKNISQFENVRQRHTVYAAQWGCRLETDRKQVIPERGYLGIKGHDLSLADRPGESNTFPCWVTQVLETPQTATLFLTLNRPPQHSEDYHIQLEMDRENHQSLAARPYPWYVHIDPKKIFYVNG